MAKPTLKISNDFTKRLMDVTKQFRADKVLVGIPTERASRSGDAMNNATILALNHFGSPAQNLAPWRVMSIGIRNAQDDIAKELKKALLAAFKSVTKGGTAETVMNQYYNRAGMVASQAVKAVITDQTEVPTGRPMPSTLATRRSQGFSGESALLVTGQLRAAITYVVK